jgi:uncharacterized repeat protein (TIGR03803 family)
MNRRTITEIGSFFVLLLAAGVGSAAQTVTTVANFNNLNGNYPIAPVMQARDGNLYGTTLLGGAYGGGSVFKLTQNGNLTTLYSFCGQFPCVDGQLPGAGLLEASDGNLYGSTLSGGNSQNCDFGCGTVFKITSAGKLTTLYSFNNSDGAGPVGTLLEGSDGNLYGTTAGGGDSSCYEGNCGTAFKLTKQGVLTRLYSFCAQQDCTDGSIPTGSLIQGNDGNLYGTTTFGGAVGNCNSFFYYGCGTIFRLTRSGRFTTLYSFCTQQGCPDGEQPSGGLARDLDGTFYGTTGFTVFKVSSGGKLTTLHTFCAQNGCPDGAGPYGSLIRGTDGNFYGTNSENGVGGEGTIFRVSATGDFAAVYSFHCDDGGCPQGRQPFSGLVQHTTGDFYGTTSSGGAYGDGTVFELSVGFGPFVTFVRDSGRAGSSGGILGQGFSGTTAVSLNGTPAQFEVVSDTFIRATVPPGATTGYVTVTTPTGTLTSNKQFIVVR